MGSKLKVSPNGAVSAKRRLGATEKTLYYAGAVATVALVWWAYFPALHGPFIFDDRYLPFAIPKMAGQPLSAWLRGVRPLLMFSYWLNVISSGANSFSYHIIGVICHCITGGLVCAIIRRLLEMSGATKPSANRLAGFATVVFLLHPVQAEAVAYISGRSETLSAMFTLAAFTVFLYRKETAISWRRSGVVLGLFGMAILSKEQVMAFPALLLLTDYWWNGRFSLSSVRANWRLYGPLLLEAAAGLASYSNLLLHSTSAGLGVTGVTWYQYLFTEFRAIFVYVRIFALPVNLTADWDFPFSKNILDHGAAAGLIALAVLAAAAWRYRRQIPLAGYGFFVFLVLMAPTSSFVPILDPIAERRLYFSMLGLLLILVDLLARVRIERFVLTGACVAVALAAALSTHVRAACWSDPVVFWEDAARKSPAKPRPHFGLAVAYNEAHRYDAALAEFETAARLETPDYSLLLEWARVYDNMDRPRDALDKLKQAALVRPTAHVHAVIGLMYAVQQQWADALAALATAQRIDANWAETYDYRAKVYAQQNQFSAAVADYRRALALDPTLADARLELARAQALLRRGRR